MASDSQGVSGRRWGRRFRQAMVVAHRYLGLTIATFLVVATLTGSAIVFFDELDDALNRDFTRVTAPAVGAKALPRPKLREMADRQLPRGYSVWELPLAPLPPDRALRFSLNYDGDGPQALTVAYADPYTGRLVGLRNDGDFTQIRNLMPLLFTLHDNLMLGETGWWLLGITAVLWTLDCFAGFYLTLPPTSTGKARKGWWARWAPSWLLRGGSLFAALFSFHRAAGLWLWPILFVFAWSSVGFLMRPVYDPVMSALFRSAPGEELPELPQPRFQPRLSWAEALARGEMLMQAEAKARGFTIASPNLLSHEPHFGLYRYQVVSSLDPGSNGDTTIWIDSDTGRRVSFWAPTGRSNGETVDSWLVQLHFGTVLGLPYRIFICVTGVAAAALSITGVVIWLRKRRGRTAKRKRQDTHATSI